MKLDSLRFHIVAAALIAATILLMWFGYRATSEWQRSTGLLVEQRTLEVSTLMIMALSRDMRGVQSQILPQLDPLAPHADPHELGDESRKGFCAISVSRVVLYLDGGTRRDGNVLRVQPRGSSTGMAESRGPDRRVPRHYSQRSEGTGRLSRLFAKTGAIATRLILFETAIGGDTYQVIARPVYGGPSHETVYSVIGFTVNIGWVREHYFSELTNQLSRIVDGNNSMALQILDEKGQLIASSRSVPDARLACLCS